MDIKGHTVESCGWGAASDIAEEYYASFTLDRSAKKHLGMLPDHGSVDIEAVAAEDPDAIAKIWVDPVDGLTQERAKSWVAAAKLNPRANDGAVDIVLELYNAYVEGDADLVEINPLILKTSFFIPARCPRSTPRSRSTATRSSDTPNTPRMTPPRFVTSASRRRTRRACSTSGSTATWG